MKSTTAGHAEEIQILLGSLCISPYTLAETCCAPSAVSDTAKNPSFLSARINCPGRTPGYCATNEGASEATTARLQLIRAFALGRSSHTCFALLGQANVQLPHKNAEFGHNLRAVILHANRLHRAFANALIAVLALVLSGLDKVSRSMLAPALACQAARNSPAQSCRRHAVVDLAAECSDSDPACTRPGRACLSSEPRPSVRGSAHGC